MNTVAEIVGWIVMGLGGLVGVCWLLAGLWELLPTWLIMDGDIGKVAARFEHRGRVMLFFGITCHNFGVGIIGTKKDPRFAPTYPAQGTSDAGKGETV